MSFRNGITQITRTARTTPSALTAIAMLAALAVDPVSAQLSYGGCGPLQAADFQMAELFNRQGTAGAAGDTTISEPTRMDVEIVNKDGAYAHSNIYFTERLGDVKFYDGAAKTVKRMGHIDTWGKSDNGLMGLALDPDFAANRFIYFWYSPNKLIVQNRQLRLTRITVKPDNTLDMASEKILIEILASKTDTWHSGGPMMFDAYGDLWVAVGNNTVDLEPSKLNVLSKTDSTQSSEWGSSNTASLRGGFFRIHPDNSAKGYSIPPGNFGEYWADKFEKLGRDDLAGQYRDPTKVLPEVYVKGERSNFSIGLHPTKRWLAWGTVNYLDTNDEFNITDHPVFSGFPYFHSNNFKTCAHDKTVEAPRNESPLNTGVVELPPAVPSALNNLVNVAIGGPIYHYDAGLDSPVKFPPHFDNKWLVAGFGGGMWAITLDTNTLKPINILKVDNGIFAGVKARNHVMSMYGRDGALYILNYDGYYNSAKNPGAMRITYKGACKTPPTTGIPPAGAGARTYWRITLSPSALKIREPGRHTFNLYDLAGRKVYGAEGGTGAEYRFGNLGSGHGAAAGGPLHGVYLVEVFTGQGRFAQRISLL